MQVYPDPVRVVAIGKPIEQLLAAPEADDNLGSSVEFCGGTHLTNTAEVKKNSLIICDLHDLAVFMMVIVSAWAAAWSSAKAHTSPTPQV